VLNPLPARGHHPSARKNRRRRDPLGPRRAIGGLYRTNRILTAARPATGSYLTSSYTRRQRDRRSSSCQLPQPSNRVLSTSSPLH